MPDVPSINNLPHRFGRLANTTMTAEAVVSNDILPQLVYQLSGQNRFYKSSRRSAGRRETQPCLQAVVDVMRLMLSWGAEDSTQVSKKLQRGRLATLPVTTSSWRRQWLMLARYLCLAASRTRTNLSRIAASASRHLQDAPELQHKLLLTREQWRIWHPW